MTEREKIIVSAYTTYLMTDFSKVRAYMEEKMGKPIFTHELADENFCAQIREVCKEDFLSLCG